MSQFVTPGFAISLPAPPNALSTGTVGPVKNQTNASMGTLFPKVLNGGLPSTLIEYANPSLPYILPMAPMANNATFCTPFSSSFNLASSISSSVGFPASATVQQTNLNNTVAFPQFTQ